MSLAVTLGFQRAPAPDGAVRVRARVGEGHVNMHGTAHGGFLYALADEAFALASNAGDADAVALSTHMDYFRAVRVGDDVEAEARAEHLGRRVATYRIEVRVGAAPVALFIGTVYRRPREEARPSSTARAPEGTGA